MVVNIDLLVINTFWYIVKFAVGMYKSKVCCVIMSCTCELVINWPLFVVRYRNKYCIHWDGTSRIFTSLNGC